MCPSLSLGEKGGGGGGWGGVYVHDVERQINPSSSTNLADLWVYVRGVGVGGGSRGGGGRGRVHANDDPG